MERQDKEISQATFLPPNIVTGERKRECTMAEILVRQCLADKQKTVNAKQKTDMDKQKTDWDKQKTMNDKHEKVEPDKQTQQFINRRQLWMNVTRIGD